MKAEVSKSLSLLSKQEKKKATNLVVVLIFSAVFDALGVASIFPFMSVVENPELINSNPLLVIFYELIAVKDQNDFLLALGGVVFLFLIASLSLKAYSLYAQVRFGLMLEYSIGKRLIEGYFGQDYEWFLSRNSSDLGRTVLSEVEMVVSNSLAPILNILAQGAVVIAILGLLIYVDYRFAMSVFVVLGFAYYFIFRFIRGFVLRIGQERINANRDRYSVINEGFGAIKEMKASSLEMVYVDAFDDPAKQYANHHASAQVIGLLPRFALEAIAFGGIILVIIFLLYEKGGLEGVIPTVSLFAFAGYRLLPSLQQIYLSLTRLRFAGPALDAIIEDFASLEPNLEKPFCSSGAQFLFRDKISTRNISYTYRGSSKSAVRNIDLIIPSKCKIGFVGPTGSGKSTMVDLLLCLFRPSSGSIEVDGVSIDSTNCGIWRRSIGYVPQQIYLSDQSIAQNIAFGIKPEEIDMSLIVTVAKAAALHDFIIDSLPMGYETIVGERGVCLSGGQRQRIGIARALYRKPRLLILDEATSALDNFTESLVMKNINAMSKEFTIVSIAHRLDSIRNFDLIYVFDQGEVVASGTYQNLERDCILFKNLILRGDIDE